MNISLFLYVIIKTYLLEIKIPGLLEKDISFWPNLSASLVHRPLGMDIHLAYNNNHILTTVSHWSYLCGSFSCLGRLRHSNSV
jgi:hypothetical protein